MNVKNVLRKASKLKWSWDGLGLANNKWSKITMELLPLDGIRSRGRQSISIFDIQNPNIAS